MNVLVAFHPEVFRTSNGTPYLKEPGVALLASTATELSNMQGFLDGFDPELDFGGYAIDSALPDAEAITKVAGQLCYLSLGPGRTKNADAHRYFDHIKESGHGSVLEHASFTLLLYGIDRAVTHEIVRHRAGMAYSQVSQRYVDGKTLRFVERPEFQNDRMHLHFEQRIDEAARRYNYVAEMLIAEKRDQLSAMPKRDARKAVNQAARACLPNETEAPIIVTGNVRAWRHFVEMRAAPAADVTIRGLAVRVSRILRRNAPLLFSDHTEETLPDGTVCINAVWRKV